MLRMKKKKKSEIVLAVILTALLAAFLGLVFYVNLSCNPEYYDGDIYSDIRFAKEAWKAKSLFPKDWLFGNQLYVVATPVWAALFYGLLHNGILAMGIASCAMTVLIVLTYEWMTRTVFGYNERLAGFLVMVGVIISKAHIATGARGAQILFTMASYYACYMITAFVVYGCYIRIRQNNFKVKHIPMAAVGILLSFATGMQSLRQTVIMILPLIVFELLMTIIVLIRDRKISNFYPIIFTAAVSLVNIVGVLFAKTLPLQQTTIYGGTEMSFVLDFKQILSRTITGFITGIYESFIIATDSGLPTSSIFPILMLLIILLGFVAAVIALAKSKAKNEAEFVIYILMLLSCASVLGVSVFTSVSCKTIYYFMVFPLLAVSVATLLSTQVKIKLIPEAVMAILFVSLIVFKGIGTWKEIKADKNPNTTTYRVARYITENGYDTLYSIFGLSWGEVSGEKIAVASGDEIYFIQLRRVVSWEENPSVEYLHLKDDYKSRDDSKSLYFFGYDYVQAKEFCQKHGIEVTEIKTFDNYYLCKFSKNICELPYEKQIDEVN